LADLNALLTRLSSTPGPSGYEGPIRAAIESAWRPLVDDLQVDLLGNIIALKRGSGNEPRRRVMLAAHMDEIALMVTVVQEGFLHVTSVGGIDIRILPGQEVMVHPSRRGPDGEPLSLPGVIGARPPHLLPPDQRDQSIPLHDHLVDLGLPAADVAHWVRPGDLVTFAREGAPLSGGRFSGRALDNRASVAAVTVCLEALQAREHQWDVLAVATVQEEVTLGGARTGAFHLAPDLALVLDVTFGRGPGVGESDGVTLDGGPAIAIGPNFHPKVVQQLRDAAARLEMPTQIEPAPTPPGTDAHAIQISQSGIPCGLISIPLRYMHSPVEIIALRDVERSGRLLAECIAGLPDDFMAGYVVT
jgi:putative aminopeptidase FrvX